jgi:hypothetical protein
MTEPSQTPPRPGEPTTSYDGTATLRPSPAAPATDPTKELQTLLRRRLALLSLISLCAVGAFAVILSPFYVRNGDWRYLVLVWFQVSGTAAYVVLLRSRRPLWLRVLRGLELGAVGVLVVYLTVDLSFSLFEQRFPGIFAEVGQGSAVLELQPLIRPDRAGDPKNLLRFQREVQATAALTSWHTVEIFDYGHAEDGTFYYVMEYLPGLTLDQLVGRHGPLPPGRAVYLLRQVCLALCEAHAAGLIHRDIKPGNVIVGERGGLPDVAKLLDFGLVQGPGLDTADARLTLTGSLVGTPAYVSPEQAGGAGELDARSDVYSLGAVAYFLLTGRPPFTGKTATLLLAAHLHEPVRPPTELRPDLPRDLEAVVLRCLEKDPPRRFGSALELGEALARCGCSGGWDRGHAAEWWRTRAAR